MDKDYLHDIISTQYNPRSLYFTRAVYLIAKKNNCDDLKWLYEACLEKTARVDATISRLRGKLWF